MRLEITKAQIFLCLKPTDMRKAFDSLAALVQEQLLLDPFGGQCFVFRNKAGNRVKLLTWDGTGLALYYKRLEEGQFVWPTLNKEGVFELNALQLNALLEGMDWRRMHTRRSSVPTVAA